jgi:hypothetical protein
MSPTVNRRPLTVEEFMPSYREWLLDEAMHEVERGCSRLFQIKSHLLRYFQDVTTGWPPEKVLLLLRARIKQLRCYGLNPLRLTEEEEAVAAEASFIWPVLKNATPGRPQAPYRFPNGISLVDVDKHGLVGLQMRAPEFRVAKTKLRRAALDSVPEEFGKPYNLNSQYLYWLQVEGCTVETTVDLDTRQHQLQLWHVVYPGTVGLSNRTMADHTPRLSFVHLLGVNDGILSWDWLTDADVSDASSLLGTLVNDFIEEVPGIIARALEQRAP